MISSFFVDFSEYIYTLFSCNCSAILDEPAGIGGLLCGKAATICQGGGAFISSYDHSRTGVFSFKKFFWIREKQWMTKDWTT